MDILISSDEIVADPADEPFLRRCINPYCTNTFIATRADHYRCHPDCGRVNNTARDERARQQTADHIRNFVGVSGVGITREDAASGQLIHDYVLITVGENSFHRDGERLATNEISRLFTTSYRNIPRDQFLSDIISLTILQDDPRFAGARSAQVGYRRGFEAAQTSPAAYASLPR